MEAARPSLDTLPSELVWEILQCCHSHDRADHIPKRYSTLKSVILVNKHLREHGLRILLREMNFSKCGDFLKKVEQFGARFAHRTNDVRCVTSPH